MSIQLPDVDAEDWTQFQSDQFNKKVQDTISSGQQALQQTFNPQQPDPTPEQPPPPPPAAPDSSDPSTWGIQPQPQPQPEDVTQPVPRTAPSGAGWTDGLNNPTQPAADQPAPQQAPTDQSNQPNQANQDWTTGLANDVGQAAQQAGSTVQAAGQQASDWITGLNANPQVAEPSQLSPAADQTQPTTTTPLTGGVGTGVDASSPSTFAQTIAPYAAEAARQLGLPADQGAAWITAMAANETGFGTALPDPGSNNFFGIKAHPGVKSGASVATTEGAGAAAHTEQANFAVYDSPMDAIKDYVGIIQRNQPDAVGAQTLQDFNHGLRQGGYYTADEGQYLSNLQRLTNQVKGDVGSALEAGGGALQAGTNATLDRVNDAVTSVGGRQSSVVPVQMQRDFERAAGMSDADAYSACGPVAAVAFAQTYGRNPTPQEAIQLARQVGWNPATGMAGVDSEAKLLNQMGVDVHVNYAGEQGLDWGAVQKDATGGNPVILDTPFHYFYVDGYNPANGAYHVGNSGVSLNGGSQWMTADQIAHFGRGPARAAIFADNPNSPAPSVATTVKGGLQDAAGNVVAGGQQIVQQAASSLGGAAQNVLQQGQQAASSLGSFTTSVGDDVGQAASSLGSTVQRGAQQAQQAASSLGTSSIRLPGTDQVQQAASDLGLGLGLGLGNTFQQGPSAAQLASQASSLQPQANPIDTFKQKMGDAFSELLSPILGQAGQAGQAVSSMVSQPGPLAGVSPRDVGSAYQQARQNVSDTLGGAAQQALATPAGQTAGQAWDVATALNPSLRAAQSAVNVFRPGTAEQQADVALTQGVRSGLQAVRDLPPVDFLAQHGLLPDSQGYAELPARQRFSDIQNRRLAGEPVSQDDFDFEQSYKSWLAQTAVLVATLGGTAPLNTAVRGAGVLAPLGTGVAARLAEHAISGGVVGLGTAAASLAPQLVQPELRANPDFWKQAATELGVGAVGGAVLGGGIAGLGEAAGAGARAIREAAPEVASALIERLPGEPATAFAHTGLPEDVAARLASGTATDADRALAAAVTRGTPEATRVTQVPTVDDLAARLEHQTGSPGVSIEPYHAGRLGNQPAFGQNVVYRDGEGNVQGVLQMLLDESGQPDSLSVAVNPARQRQGIATALYDAARAAGYDVEAASGRSGYTEEGAAFARARAAPAPQATDVAAPARTRTSGEQLPLFTNGHVADPVELAADSPESIVAHRNGDNLLLPGEPSGNRGPVQIVGPRGDVISTVASRPAGRIANAPGVRGLTVDPEEAITGIVRGREPLVNAPSAETQARMPNMTRFLADRPDLQAQIQRAAEENPSLFDAYQRGTITHDNLINNLAPKVGMTAEQFRNSPIGKGWNDSELLALRAAAARSQEQMQALADDIHAAGGWDNLTPVEKVEATAKITDAAQLAAVAKGGGSTVARALNQQKIAMTSELARAIRAPVEAREAGVREATATTRASRAAQLLEDTRKLDTERQQVARQFTPTERGVPDANGKVPSRSARGPRGDIYDRIMQAYDELEKYHGMSLDEKETDFQQLKASRDRVAANRQETPAPEELLKQLNKQLGAERKIFAGRRNTWEDQMARAQQVEETTVPGASRQGAGQPLSHNPDIAKGQKTADQRGTQAWLKAQQQAAERDASKAGSEAKRAFDRQLNVRERQSAAARAALEKMGALGNNPEQMVRQFLEAQSNHDPYVMAKFLQGLKDPGWGQRFQNLRFAGMLSATTTHTQQALGNWLNVGLGLPIHATASAIDLARYGAGKALGQDVQRHFYMGELARRGGRYGITSPRLQGQLEGAVSSLPDMWKTLKYGISPRELAQSRNVQGVRQGFGAEHLFPNNPRLAATVNAVAEGPLRALEAGDILFRNAERGGQVRSIANRYGMQEGLSGDALDARVQDIMQNLEEYPDLVHEAERYATRAVLQEQPPLLRPQGTAADAVGQVIPFWRTSLNQYAQGLGLTPAGLISSAKAGLRGDVPEAEQRLARAIVGTGIMAGAGHLANNGFLTADYPDSAEERSTLPNGWQPWSLRTPWGQYLSYSNLGPVGGPLAAGAIIGDTLRQPQNWEKAKGDPIAMGSKMLGSFGNYTVSNTMLQDLNTVISALKSGDPVQGGQRALGQMAASYVPLGALQRQIERATGMATRDPHGALDYIRQAVLPLAGSVPEKLDALGHPLVGGQTGVGAFASPVRYDYERDSPVLQVLRENQVGIPAVPKELTARGGTIPLTPDEQQSYTIQRGATLERAIAAEMATPGYHQLNDVGRQKVLSRIVQNVDTQISNRIVGGLPKADFERRLDRKAAPQPYLVGPQDTSDISYRPLRYSGPTIDTGEEDLQALLQRMRDQGEAA